MHARSTLTRLLILFALLLALAVNIGPAHSAAVDIYGPCLSASVPQTNVASVPLADGTVQAFSGPTLPDYLDPTTLTDAQLACYGFPPRPSSPAALASWKALYAHLPKTWRNVSAAYRGPTLPVASAPTSFARMASVYKAAVARRGISPLFKAAYTVHSETLYAGEAMSPTGHNGNHAYTEAGGWWTQQEYRSGMPAPSGHPYGRAVTDWVGLGGLDTNLYQAGTQAFDKPCDQPYFCGSYAFFWQVVAAGGQDAIPAQIIPNLTPTPGWVSSAYILFYPIYPYFQVCSEEAGGSCATVAGDYWQNNTTDSQGLDSAEWITEDSGTPAGGHQTFYTAPAYPYNQVNFGPGPGATYALNLASDWINGNGIDVLGDQGLPFDIYMMGGPNINQTAMANWLSGTLGIETQGAFQNCSGSFADGNAPLAC